MAENSATTQPPLRIGTRRSNQAVIQAEGIRHADQASDWCELAAIPIPTTLVVKAGLPYTCLKTLPECAVVGTSSVQRSAQLRRLYSHLRFANLRGNVETRLAKVDNPESEYTCMVISAAGSGRVGLRRRIDHYLDSKDGGIFHTELLKQLVDQKSTLACLAEQSLMRTLEGGCSVPIGVETEWVGQSEDLLGISAIVASLDGSQNVQDTIDTSVRTVDEATALGKELAARLVKAGADAILNDINADRPAKD
ncbi:hypothetical protein DV736_g6533, partial [Chaetothyriales sp. CBS 134916]